MPAHADLTSTPVPYPVQEDFSTIQTLHKITLDSSVSYMQTVTVRSQMMQRAEARGLTVLPGTGFRDRFFYVMGSRTEVAMTFGNLIGEPKRYPVEVISIGRSVPVTAKVQMSGWSWGSAEQGTIVNKAVTQARLHGLTIVSNPTSGGNFQVVGPIDVVMEAFAEYPGATLSIVRVN